MINKEQEPVRTTQNSPHERRVSRRVFLKFLGLGAAFVISENLSGCSPDKKITSVQKVIKTLFPEEPEETPVIKEKVVKASPGKEISSTPSPTVQKETTKTGSGDEDILSKENRETRENSKQNQDLEKLPEQDQVPQETPVTPEIPKKEVLGGIDFLDAEKPLGISYHKDFGGQETVKLENVKILVFDTSGKNYKDFNWISGWKEGERKVFVYQDVSGAFILLAHDGYAKKTNKPLELEPWRKMIEGPVTKPYPVNKIKENLEKVIGMEFVFAQNGKKAKFEVVQAKRLDPEEREEFLKKQGNLSEFLEPINDPENSLFLLTCSARQPKEPAEGQNEYFSGRLVFILQYSPETSG